MTFPKIRDEEGNEVDLTNGNFEVFRESRDPRVREDAFRLYFGAFAKFKNTLTALYAGNVQMDNFRAVTRHYPDACTASLDGNNVPVSVYDSLVSAVHEALPDMRRYLEIRRKRLGLKELHLCDLYTPIVENVEFPVSFAESRDLVKKALLPLGAEYQTLLDRAYDEKWMDVYENKGKDTGAFSCGIYGVHPYVLLNYTDTLEDAFTVAHELGHSMHSFFSDRANDYANAGYSLMVAEVASTVNEVLLSRYLLKTETDPRRKAYVLNRFLEGFRTTLFRQTLFAEFERKAHEMDAAGEPLTASALSQVYHGLHALYYGGCVTDMGPNPPFLPVLLCVPVRHGLQQRRGHRLAYPGDRGCLRLPALPHHRRQRLSPGGAEDRRSGSDQTRDREGCPGRFLPDPHGV